MMRKYSKLNQRQKSDLYSNLRDKYDDLNQVELNNLYENSKFEYEKLANSENLLQEARILLSSHRQEIYKAEGKLHFIKVQNHKSHIDQMGLFKRFDNFLSSKTISAPISSEESTTERNLAGLLKKTAIYENDLREAEKRLKRRKELYHEIKVMAEIRREWKEELTKALATRSVGKSRINSQSLKRRQLDELDDNYCPYCQSYMSDPVLDHIYPVSKGGVGTHSNTILVCNDCNSKKTNMTLIYFCKKFNLNFEKISDILLKRGKEF